jgi:hypothetical protein
LTGTSKYVVGFSGIQTEFFYNWRAIAQGAIPQAIATDQRMIYKSLKRRIFLNSQDNKFVKCVSPISHQFF